ncbi:NAD(P)/FAD-dependent oxidoreductase [Virgibacillus siamensis]|uniref:NAD(P)/FAD-dependent oxidoreductase n=1 Tax=Virgibacillus siamensis TaxID=480071 RepID=UPI0009842FE0|nr:NAD(P)/FAD-dependent oxidoreductase [Virgibacillus siamensis]
MSEEKIYDLTIIGAGPIGLFTAFYAGMRNASVHMIDSMPEVGGQLAALYPDKYIYDVAGFPNIKAKDLVEQLYEQSKTFSPKLSLNESVKNVIQLEDGTFQIDTSGSSYFARSVIITAGAGAFQPRKLKVDRADQFEDRNLHYFVKKLEQFKNRRVLICGGGDSAVDWSLALEPVAKEVILIHRRDKFRAHEHSLSLLQESNVHIKTPYEVGKLVGNDKIEQVMLQEIKGENVHVLDVDDVIVNFGFVTSLGPLKDWGMETSKNAIYVNQQMETSIPGIFAAGDVCAYDGKPRLIATGFGEATIAVNHAKAMIDPKARLHVHSTHLFATAAP